MKKIIICCLTLFMASLTAYSQVEQPRPVSPAAKLTQTIGLTDITVEYSRPRVTFRGQDRTGQIWGQRVAYGFNKINFGSQGEIPWRAGANENTLISFENDVKIEGKELKAGKYSLHMAIYEDGKVTVIFSNTTTAWGSFWYEEKDDALRVDVKMEDHPHTEVLTYDFDEMGVDYAVLALTWEKKRIPFKIEVDVHNLTLQSFRNELKGVAGFDWKGPLGAAQYCMQNNINHEEALTWADWAINNGNNFWTTSTKAGLLLQMDKEEEAIEMMDQAAGKANMNQLNQLGYQLLGMERFDKAIEYFQMNVDKHPEIANVHDSLGEAYKAKGDKKNAIKSFKKALSLDPPANVKANSIALLKELGVEYKGD